MDYPQDDAAPAWDRGLGVTSLGRLDDTTSDNRQVEADPFHLGQAADEGIIAGRLIFDGPFAREHASVIDRQLFQDPVWRLLYERLQEQLRRRGVVDPATIAAAIKSAGLSEREARERLDDLREYMLFGKTSALCALERLVEQRNCVQLAELCDTLRNQVGTPSMSYARAHELIGEHLDSFPAYKTLGLQELNWATPIPASALGSGEPIGWRWYGYAAVGHVTLFTGLWKAGKTTLLAHLLAAFEHGGDLAGTVTPGRVLVVSEESAALWQRRITDLSIGDHAEFLIRPFKLRPTQRLWEQFIEHLAGLAERHSYAVVIFDTLSTLWPVTNENDAAETLTALTPLHRITEAGAAVLLVHHPRKSEGDQGQASRGSGALPGFVDIIIELRRFDPQRREDRRRVLTTYSRFDETPGKVVIELTDDGYTTVGTKAESTRRDRLEVVAELLPDTEPGLTAAEVRDAWPDDGIPKPGLRSLHADLLYGYEQRRWQRTGEGKKGDAFRFLQGNTYRGAGIESEGHEGPAA